MAEFVARIKCECGDERSFTLEEFKEVLSINSWECEMCGTHTEAGVGYTCRKCKKYVEIALRGKYE